MFEYILLRHPFLLILQSLVIVSLKQLQFRDRICRGIKLVLMSRYPGGRDISVEYSNDDCCCISTTSCVDSMPSSVFILQKNVDEICIMSGYNIRVIVYTNQSRNIYASSVDIPVYLGPLPIVTDHNCTLRTDSKSNGTIDNCVMDPDCDTLVYREVEYVCDICVTVSVYPKIQNLKSVKETLISLDLHRGNCKLAKPDKSMVVTPGPYEDGSCRDYSVSEYIDRLSQLDKKIDNAKSNIMQLKDICNELKNENEKLKLNLHCRRDDDILLNEINSNEGHEDTMIRNVIHLILCYGFCICV